jgi:hypothetical protein
VSTLGTSVSEESVKLSMLLGLGWTADHVREFAIGEPSNTSFSKQNVARLKPISELALTVSLLRRCGLELPVLDTIAKWIWRECDNGLELTRLLLARSDFLPCCALYSSMHQMGFSSPNLDAVVGLLAKSDMAGVLPLQPWSRLALQYNLWKLRITPWEDIRIDDLYVLRRPEPWIMSGELAYAITHEIMYLTDFGFRELGHPDVELYVSTWIPYWTRIFAEIGDDDVTGELAMISGCLARPRDEFFSLPLATVIAHQQRDGSVIGPPGAGAFLFAQSDSDERRMFLGRYHTTLVMVMAAAMALLRGGFE